MEYIAYLHKDRGSDFGVSFPDFPGCVTAGRTLAEAHAMAAEALKLHIAGMVEDREPIPAPSSLDALKDDPAREKAVAVLVRVEPPADKTMRVNITVRESQIEAIDRLADKSGLTRSAYMVQSSLGVSRTHPPKKLTRSGGRRQSVTKAKKAAEHRPQRRDRNMP
jgi:predicted RNase H-like HicB family nuclease